MVRMGATADVQSLVGRDPAAQGCCFRRDRPGSGPGLWGLTDRPSLFKQNVLDFKDCFFSLGEYTLIVSGQFRISP